MGRDAEVDAEILAALRSICLGLPEAREEAAWVGIRWRVGRRTFAHVLTVESGWPPAYARAAAIDQEGSTTVLMFRSAGRELRALRDGGPPFFGPPWRADEVGLELADRIDWDEITELLTESYCVLAPRRLVALVDRPGN